MLRLSRFRGRRGVLGRELWLSGRADDTEITRGISSIALENHDDKRYAVGRNHGFDHVPSRGFSDEAPSDENKKEKTGNADKRIVLSTIEKNRMLQDEVSKYLYGSGRGQVDVKLLLGTLYIKSGMQMPTYSSRPKDGQFLGDVVVSGKRFIGIAGSNAEEAERNAASTVLNWVLGRKVNAKDSSRGARGGVAAGVRGRGRGRGRVLRGRGGIGSQKCAQHVATRPIGCMQVEVNYKLMKAVVLYPTSEILYPYKEFPARQNLKEIYKNDGHMIASSSSNTGSSEVTAEQ